MDLPHRSARAIPVRALPPQYRPPGSEAASFNLRSYQVELERVRMEVESGRPGFVQLAHPWSPALTAFVNGERATAMQGSLDLIVLPVPAGSSTIELRMEHIPYMKTAAMISLAGLAATLAGATVLVRKGRRASSHG
jgi:hypothetical protein